MQPVRCVVRAADRVPRLSEDLIAYIGGDEHPALIQGCDCFGTSR